MLKPGQNQSNLYESAEQAGEVLQAEAERLRSLDYPAQRSVEAIQDIEGKTILDVGAGNNQALGRAVREQGGHYIALDVRMDAAADQHAYGALSLVGSVDKLPLADGAVEISHARFVLGHFADSDRRQAAILELVRVAKEKAVLMDYDWDGWQGSVAMNTFKKVAQEIAARRGFNPNYGAILKAEAEQLAPAGSTVHEQRFHREPGTYYPEILGLAGFMRQQVEAEGDTELLSRLDGVTSTVRAESEQSDPLVFTTPDIIAVTISKA